MLQEGSSLDVDTLMDYMESHEQGMVACFQREDGKWEAGYKADKAQGSPDYRILGRAAVRWQGNCGVSEVDVDAASLGELGFVEEMALPGLLGIAVQPYRQVHPKALMETLKIGACPGEEVE